MTEHIVKAVRLLQIIHLFRATHPPSAGKTAVGQMIEKYLIGNQTIHRDDLPAGVRAQNLIQRIKIRYAFVTHAQLLQAA